MSVRKVFWGVRALVYKLLLNKIGMPSYLGKPLYIEGGKGISIGSRVRIFPGIRLQTINHGRIKIGNNVAIEQNVQIVSMTSKVSIGNDVTIAANVFISNVNHNYTNISRSVMDQGDTIRDTKIGDGCFLGYGSVLLPGTILGQHCIVGSNAMLNGTYDDYTVIVGAPGKVIKKYNIQEKKWEKVT